MTAEAIALSAVSRSFGALRAVDDLSFSITKGEVVGFIGANGAGKTTTMRMMALLDLPDAGEIRLFGRTAFERPQELKRLVGWMPDAFGAYEHMTVREYLDLFARAYGYRGVRRRQRLEEVLEFTELGQIADREMIGLSKGMSQRLCLGRVLVHDPPLLIMDEPAAGLDPKARLEFKHLVRLLAQDGKTIFISSHILSELEEMCSRMIFIDGGRLLHEGKSGELTRHEQPTIEIRLLARNEEFYQWAILQPDCEVLERLDDRLRLLWKRETQESIAAFLGEVVRQGFPVVEFSLGKRKLEDVFVELVTKDGR